MSLVMIVQVCILFQLLSLADLMQPWSTGSCLPWPAQKKSRSSCKHTLIGWAGAPWYVVSGVSFMIKLLLTRLSLVMLCWPVLLMVQVWIVALS